MDTGIGEAEELLWWEVVLGGELVEQVIARQGSREIVNQVRRVGGALLNGPDLALNSDVAGNFRQNFPLLNQK